MIQRTVLFSGRVQGVGFRYTTCRIAARYRVAGYVRNLADGRVEAVIEGKEPIIEEFVHALSDEMSGYIRDMQHKDGIPTGTFAGFEIRL